MRSLVGSVVQALSRTDRAWNRAPVPYTPTTGQISTIGLYGTQDRAGHLQTMANNGTVFGIVDRISTSTAAVGWHMHRLSRVRGGSAAVCSRCEKPGVALVDDHLALRIWNRPNDFYTRQELVEAGQQHHELTGETWLLVERDERMRGLPLGLWPVRPDRMDPVPSQKDFLAGYVYRGPRGEKIPLDLDEVIQIRRPDPEDPFRGLGAIQAALRDIDSARLAAEWNRNFFLNSAEPGGIIKAPSRLSDTEFNELRMRWNEQHKGVSRAHRVAILEGYDWVDRKYSMRDMEFTKLRELSRDMIREAFGIPKFALGDVDDVNRATAEASKAWFAEQVTVPRLERWKLALNNDFLPMFGTAGQGLEFVYDDPVPPDRESENAERDSKVGAWATLVNAGAHPDDAAAVVGLPPIRIRETVTVTPAPAADDDDMTPGPAGAENVMRWQAVEEIDDDTCDACREVHGTLYRTRQQAWDDYPGGAGYRHCDGQDNCRGRVVRRRKNSDD
jgi:HK97 family phage portal protein